MSKVEKSIYQLRFNEKFLAEAPMDVTPYGFGGFDYHNRAPLGRGVRRIEESVAVLTPADAVAYLNREVYVPFEHFDQEELWVLLLNTKHRITHDVMVYRGNVKASLVRVAEVFKDAVRVNVPNIILAHNHPSGDPTPSAEDINVTRMISQAGKLLDIDVLDHVVVGNGQWVSLRERGLGGW